MKLRPKESSDLWPASAVELWSVSSLSASPYNAREHTEADIDAVAASMKRWGVTAPALVDEAGVIIYGHCRVLAARKNGFETYPVVVAKGWTEAEKRAYCLADNQLAARATWDSETLANELAFLKTDGFDLGLLGFDAIDLKDLLQPLGGELGNPEDVLEPPETPVTRPGDVWLLGRHRVCCGDCTQPASVAATLGDLTPTLMVTDPPYGVDYDPVWRRELKRGSHHSVGKVLNDDRVDWRAAWAHFPGSVAYVWHGGLYGGQVANSLISSGLEPRAQIVWAKPHFVLSRGDYHWQHETCWYAVRKGGTSHWNGDRKQSTVWEIANNSAVGNPERETTWGHGTQKPLECMRRPIENNSVRGDVIYDPFLGSGTTLIAAEMTDRICVGLELSPAYVDVIVRRWESVTGHSASLQATGREFQAVAAARSEETPTSAEEDASIPDCGGGNVSRAT